MAQTLDCPKCGAPLSFEPHPGDETVVCPYCNETVIIPEELRIPLPRGIVQQQSPPERTKRPNWVVIAIVLVIGVAICVTTSIIVNRSN